MDSLLGCLEECLIIRGKAHMGMSVRGGPEGSHILVVGLDDNEYTIYDPSTGEYFFTSSSAAENKIATKQALEVIFAHYRDERGCTDISLSDLGGIIDESNILKEGQELVKQFEMLRGIIKDNADIGISSSKIIETLSYDLESFRNYIEIIQYEITTLAVSEEGYKELLKSLQAIPEDVLDEFIDSINTSIDTLYSTIAEEEWVDFQQDVKNISNRSLLDLLKSAIEECDYEGDVEDGNSEDPLTDPSRSGDSSGDEDVSGRKHSDSVNDEENDNREDQESSGFSSASVEESNALLEFMLQKLFSWLDAMPEHLQEKFLNSAPIKSLINELSIRVVLIMHEVKFEFSYYDRNLDNGSSDDTQNNIDDTAKILNEASEDLVDTTLVYNYSVVSKMIFVSSGSTSFIGVSTSYHLDHHQENLHGINAEI